MNKEGMLFTLNHKEKSLIKRYNLDGLDANVAILRGPKKPFSQAKNYLFFLSKL